MEIRTIRTTADTTTVQKDNTEVSVRPKYLKDYIGQEKMKKAVGIALISAKKRAAAMTHTLLYGAPGLGKTTLAGIIASEMGANMQYVTGACIEKPKDIVPVLMQLNEKDVLFIDEIHRMDKTAEEVLYSAMEDNFVSISVGQGEQARQIKLTLPPFTLVGATTKAGMLTKPLRDRFGLLCRLEYYTVPELAAIAKHTAEAVQLTLDDECAAILAECSRGTPRIVNRFVVRIRDYVLAKDVAVSKDTIYQALASLGIAANGLDNTDFVILQTLRNAAQPVGIKTLSEIVGESVDTIEEMHEPYLLQSGFVQKTARGRIITEKGKETLKKERI